MQTSTNILLYLSNCVTNIFLVTENWWSRDFFFFCVCPYNNVQQTSMNCFMSCFKGNRPFSVLCQPRIAFTRYWWILPIPDSILQEFLGILNLITLKKNFVKLKKFSWRTWFIFAFVSSFQWFALFKHCLSHNELTDIYFDNQMLCHFRNKCVIFS